MKFFEAPTVCPVCAAPCEMQGEYLVCLGFDCPAQILGGITRWLGKVGVLHFGDSMVAAAVEAGILNSLGDLYRVTEQQLSDLYMDGRKVGGAARRAYESLHACKEMPVETFLGSLGINLCGRRMVGMLVEAGFDDLEKLRAASLFDLSVVPGFGPVKAVAFHYGLQEKKEVIEDLLAAGVVIKKPEAKKAPSGSRMKGVSVCFTGVRDAALEARIVEEGGEIKSGVSRGLTLLVCKDPNSTSSKSQKARELGTEVISLQDMRSRVS